MPMPPRVGLGSKATNFWTALRLVLAVPPVPLSDQAAAWKTTVYSASVEKALRLVGPLVAVAPPK
jgi:hypothetical protein